MDTISLLWGPNHTVNHPTAKEKPHKQLNLIDLILSLRLKKKKGFF